MRRWRERRHKLLRSALPLVEPEWRVSRPYADGSFARANDGRDAAAADAARRFDVSALDARAVEALLVDDMLHALAGCPPTDSVVAVSPFADGSAALGARLSFDQDGAYAGRVPSGTRAIAEQVLRTAEDFTALNEYAEECSFYHAGAVRNALGGALRHVLSEYLCVLAQLEDEMRSTSGRATVQRLSLRLQPTARELAAVRRVVEQAGRDTRGGALVDALYRQVADSEQGAGAAGGMCRYLLDSACAPWLRMLCMWVRRGELDDPQHEFCVQGHESVRRERVAVDFNSAFWEQRYTLRRDRLPECIAHLGGRIVMAGKYWTVIAGAEERPDTAGAPLPRMERHALTAEIDASFDAASRALLAMMTDERAGGGCGDLFARLRSLRHLFLCGRSDALLNLLGAAAHMLDEECGSALELSMPKHDDDVRSGEEEEDGDGGGELAAAATSRREAEAAERLATQQQSALSAALEMAIKQSSCAEESHAAAVSCVLLPYSLTNQLLRILSVSGSAVTLSREGAAELAAAAHPSKTRDARLTVADALALDYDAPWPVCLVLNRRVITKYQLLFRQLLHLHVAARGVEQAWREHQRIARECAGAASSSATTTTVTTDDDRGHGAAEVWDALRVACGVRARMLTLLHNVLHYFTVEVIEPRWSEFERAANNAATVDELMQAHDEFLDTCLKECLLTNVRLLKAMGKAVHVCEVFAAYSRSFANAVQAAASTATGDARADGASALRGDISVDEAHATLQPFDHGGDDRDDDKDNARNAAADDAADAAHGRVGDTDGSLRRGLEHLDLASADDSVIAARRATAARQSREARLAANARRVARVAAGKHFARTVRKFEDTFDRCVSRLLHLLQCTHRESESDQNLQHLCARLDFNEFYSRRAGDGGVALSAGAAARA